MDAAIQLRAGDEAIHLLHTGDPELALRILALLDGRLDRAALLERVESVHGPFVGELLDALAEWLVDAEAQTGDLAYLARFARPGAEAERILAASRIVVLGHSPSVELAERLCAEHGLAVASSETGEPSDLGPDDTLLCVSERPDLTLQLHANALAVRSGAACLFVDLSHGRHATVGPFYVPGESACIGCFRIRLRENAESHAELIAAERLMLETGEALPAYGTLPAHRHWVLGMAVAELVAHRTRHRPTRTASRALTVSFEEMRVWSEPVWRVDGCESCSG